MAEEGCSVGVDAAPKHIKGIAWFEQFTGNDCKIASVSMLNLRKGSPRHTCLVELESPRQAESFSNRVNDADLNARARVLLTSKDVEAFRATAQNPDAIAAFNPDFGTKEAAVAAMDSKVPQREPPRRRSPIVYRSPPRRQSPPRTEEYGGRSRSRDHRSAHDDGRRRRDSRPRSRHADRRHHDTGFQRYSRSPASRNRGDSRPRDPPRNGSYGRSRVSRRPVSRRRDDSR
mmetsp:Transcript_3502/g.8720  ORF Transcript_3502/g.8720 Transcript_3502/m.8720 type:complete len:231 (-) Transcript_3502:47-739(-)